MASYVQPSVHTIVSLSILMVICVAMLFLLFRFICWILADYGLMGEGDILIDCLWIASTICGNTILCVAMLLSRNEATQEDVKTDSE